MQKTFLVLFLLSTLLLHAQTSFKPGFVISLNNDTTYGEIDSRGDLQMSKICRFKDAANEVIEYYPGDILAFRFVDGKYFVSKQYGGESEFLEFLIKGKVNIYYLRSDDGNRYFIDKEDLGLTEIPYEEGIRMVDGKRVLYNSTKHIGFLKILMQDAPELFPQINVMQKPGHNNLMKLAEKYHNTVCDDDKCIVYEKKLPVFKVEPEVVAGVVRYMDVVHAVNNYNLQGGVIGNIWMPRAHENIYLRTGLVYARPELSGIDKSILKIPVQLEYIYPGKIMKPKIAYGFNFYQPAYISVGIMAGFNIELSKNMSLTLQADVDFIPNEYIGMIPDKLMAYGVLSGVCFRF